MSPSDESVISVINRRCEGNGSDGSRTHTSGMLLADRKQVYE